MIKGIVKDQKDDFLECYFEVGNQAHKISF
jgi:hypothetical protein